MKLKLMCNLSLACLSFFVGCGNDPRNLLPTWGSERESIQGLERERSLAQQNRDYAKMARTQFEINRLTELEGAQSLEERMDVSRKYQILQDVLDTELAEYRERPVTRRSKHAHLLNDNNDFVYPEPFDSVYHELALREVKRVFKDFGPLYVNTTVDAKGKPAWQSYSVQRPWAGYWYPFHDKSLYTGENSPLVKFDTVMRKMGIASNVAAIEADRYTGMRPDSWEGLCDALAIANTLTPEPKAPKVIAGVEFSIADQKALATFSHHSFERTVYGIRYTGGRETDGTYQDIKPEAFHRVAVHMLGVAKQAPVIDDHAGPAVWNKPLFNYRFTIEKDPKYDFAFLVTAKALLVKERLSEKNDPTVQADFVSPEYTYRLYVDKRKVEDGKYLVIAGGWTGESINEHPDTIMIPHKKGELKSHNKTFNENIAHYKKLFTNSSSANL